MANIYTIAHMKTATTTVFVQATATWYKTTTGLYYQVPIDSYER